MPGKRALHIIIALLLALILLATVQVWLGRPQAQEFGDLLFIESGTLENYRNVYHNYEHVNIRRLDGSLAGRNGDLELLMAELIMLEYTIRAYRIPENSVAGQRYAMLVSEARLYHRQDQRQMLLILQPKLHENLGKYIDAPLIK